MFTEQPLPTFITPGRAATFVCCALTIGTFSLVLVTIGFFLLVVYLLGLMLTALTEQCSHIAAVYGSWPAPAQVCIWLAIFGLIAWRVPRINRFVVAFFSPAK